MSPIARTFLLGAAVVALATVVSFADNAPAGPVTLDQGIDAATLYQYHHTDQGTRLLPAAFLAALRMPDDSKLMSPANVSKWGFLVDSSPPDKLNPYQWPIGFSISDGKEDGGIPTAGITCAACHTGEIDYQGRQVRIEGGQSYINLPAFQKAVYAALKGDGGGRRPPGAVLSGRGGFGLSGGPGAGRLPDRRRDGD